MSFLPTNNGYSVPLFTLFIVPPESRIGTKVLESSTYHEVLNYLEDNQELKIFAARGNNLFLTPTIKSEL